MRLVICTEDITVARWVARVAIAQGFLTDVVQDCFDACRTLQRDSCDALLLDAETCEWQVGQLVRLVQTVSPEVAVACVGRSREEGRRIRDRAAAEDLPVVMKGAVRELRAFLDTVTRGNQTGRDNKETHSEGGTPVRRTREASRS